MGPIKGEGPHGEVSLSLFIVELERWAIILHLLISLDPIDGFMSRDLQVKALTEPLHFDVFLLDLTTSKPPLSCLGFQMRQVAHFEGKGAPWVHLLGHYEHPGHSFCSVKCTLALFGWFFYGGEV